jgi:hypothetical protein
VTTCSEPSGSVIPTRWLALRQSRSGSPAIRAASSAVWIPFSAVNRPANATYSPALGSTASTGKSTNVFVVVIRLERNGMRLHFWPAARGQHLHQMTPAGLPAKGLFLGRWLYPFLERIPDPAAKQRLGVLSADLPKRVLLRRIAGRVRFWMVDNPLTMAALRALGARRSKRNAITDLYYDVIFRRNMWAGYYEAKRSAQAGRPLCLTKIETRLSDRGDA